MLPRIFVPVTQITPQSNPPVFLRWTRISNDTLYSATAQPSCTHRQTNIRIVARSAVKAGEACAHDRKSIRIFRRGVTTTTSLRSRRAVDRS